MREQTTIVVNDRKRVNTDLLMLFPSLYCFLIVALMTMVMKNSADAQPDQNYGATLFIKVSIMVISLNSKYFHKGVTLYQHCSNGPALLNNMQLKILNTIGQNQK